MKACLAKAIDHNMIDSIEEIEVGAVVLAPGYEEFDARLRGEFGFGRYDNVVTNVQFERMLSAGGPFGGHLQRPSRRQRAEEDRIHPVRRLARCREREALLLVGLLHGGDQGGGDRRGATRRASKPTIFYTDIRAFGKDFDRYYERAKTNGVRFVRSMISRVVEMPGTKNLRHFLHQGRQAGR